MQLDSTRIAIRERDILDICDLSLQVFRVFARPLLLALAVGIVPMMALNYLLLGMLDYERLATPGPHQSDNAMTYYYACLTLVIWEIPLATAPATLFLGQAMFAPEISGRQLIRDLRRSLPQLLVFQVFLRGLLTPICLWILPYTFRPYLNEVILLERNPLYAKRNGMSTWKRCNALHDGSFGDLLGRWMATLVFAALMTVSFYYALWFGYSKVLRDSADEAAKYSLVFPLALWLTVGYFTVVRFLSYLDLRIRREGWEVELQMRAEAASLTRLPT